MKVAIIGTGYVGLPTGVGLAELGHDVVCIDRDLNKIEALKSGKITLYEDGLETLLLKNLSSGKLTFTTSMQDGVQDADIVMIAVGTPTDAATHEVDMSYVHNAASELAAYLNGYTVVATKSTVPVGTGDVLDDLITKANPQADFDVVSLPEFLREGFAVHDFFNPDRIVIGANTPRAKQALEKLYAPLADKTQMLYVSRRSSETIKYASNAFLAIKIHYINEIANFCEQAGADVQEVAKGMGLDSRIGKKFLNAGPGYGGSCFPKDTHAMAQMGRKHGVTLGLVETAITGNVARRQDMAKRILSAVPHKTSPCVAVLGLAFKGGTDDCRESPAVEIVQALLRLGAQVQAYDPQAMDNAKAILGDGIIYAQTPYEAAKDADVLAVLTEWDEFKDLDLSHLAAVMPGKIIVDLRNMVSVSAAIEAGFDYIPLGRR